MTKILMAAAVVLASGTSLAFAANSQLPSPIDPTTEHCSYLEMQFRDKPAMHYSSAIRQAAEEKALSLCRQDRHKNGGIQRAAVPGKPSILLPARNS
jgi:hypothetical protein